MKVLKILIVFVLFFSFNEISAQTKTGNQNPALKAEAEKVLAHKNAIKKSKAVGQNKEVIQGGSTLDENDQYMGRKEEFLNQITSSELPADFPKYEKKYNLDGYNIVIDDYYATHKDILKPQVRAKIEQSHPSK